MAKKRSNVKKRKRVFPTERQSRFAAAFMKSRNAREAAILAGYSAKNPDQSAHQALKSEGLRQKVSEMLDEAGLSIKEVIHKHLVPLLAAKSTKFATDKGEITDFVEVEDNSIRAEAVDMTLRMHGAYAREAENPGVNVGVKVIVLDAPRPQRGVVMDDVKPGELPPPTSPNGHKT